MKGKKNAATKNATTKKKKKGNNKDVRAKLLEGAEGLEEMEGIDEVFDRKSFTFNLLDKKWKKVDVDYELPEDAPPLVSTV